MGSSMRISAAALAALAVAAAAALGQPAPQQREGENVTHGLDAAQRAQTSGARGKWEPAKAFPMPMEELVGAALDGKFYAMQGLTDGGFQPMGVMYAYDPAADEWIKKAPMPLQVHHAM